MHVSYITNQRRKQMFIKIIEKKSKSNLFYLQTCVGKVAIFRPQKANFPEVRRKPADSMKLTWPLETIFFSNILLYCGLKLESPFMKFSSIFLILFPVKLNLQQTKKSKFVIWNIFVITNPTGKKQNKSLLILFHYFTYIISVKTFVWFNFMVVNQYYTGTKLYGIHDMDMSAKFS